MAHLNLLPWRELRRKEIDRQVRNIAIGVALSMAGLVYWGYLYMGGLIEEQNQRNSYLETEIKNVEKELKEVNKVKKKKAELLSRMEVIQRLQSDRTRMVKLFDGLARNLPKGMYLSLFEIKDRQLINGFDELNQLTSNSIELRNHYPSWPFNSRILRRFFVALGASFLPIIISLLQNILIDYYF